MFTTSLKGTEISWFYGLKQEPIDYFKELSRIFQMQFATSMNLNKEANHLFSIVQNMSKTLKS